MQPDKTHRATENKAQKAEKPVGRIMPIPGQPVIRRPGAVVSLGEIIHSGRPYSLNLPERYRHFMDAIYVGNQKIMRPS